MTFHGFSAVRIFKLVILPRYCAETEAWSTVAPMLGARYGHAMAAVDGRIYVRRAGEAAQRSSVLEVTSNARR